MLKEFHSDVNWKDYPEVGVVGIAGPVDANKCKLTMITHWGTEDGDLISKNWNMDFRFVNDFIVASIGASVLQHKDYHILGSSGEARI